MTDTKDWWKSKTVWGGLVALGGALAGLLGVDVEANLQEEIVAAVAATASSIGALVAIFGRFDARATIG